MLKQSLHEVPPQRHWWFKFLAAVFFILALADIVQAIISPSYPLFQSILLIVVESASGFVFFGLAKQDEELSRNLHYRILDTDKRIRDCAEKILENNHGKATGDHIS